MGAEDIRKSHSVTGEKDTCTAKCKSHGSTDKRVAPEIKNEDFRKNLIHSFIHAFLEHLSHFQHGTLGQKFLSIKHNFCP